MDPYNAFLDYPPAAVASNPNGPLSGLTLAVKDIFDVAGYKSGWGNPVRLEEAQPAEKSNSAVQALLDSGARVVGKTQTEELAFSMIGQNVHFPHPINPRAKDRVTGGSSSGSVAAVAGGLVDIGTASDTGGSVRAPASFCGLIGLRTSHGAIPLDHTMPLAPSFDTFGWFAKDMATYRKVASILLGTAPGNALKRPLAIAELDAFIVPAVADEYALMRTLVSDLGGAPKISTPPPQSFDELYWCMRKLQAREAWDAHGAWISSGDRKLGKAVADRFAFGSTVSDSDVATETPRRAAFIDWLGNLLGEDGYIVMPTVTDLAPKADGSPEDFATFREASLRLLCFSSLSGFPQLTLPLGEVSGAPYGISLLGPKGSDLALLDLGQQIMGSEKA